MVLAIHWGHGLISLNFREKDVNEMQLKSIIHHLNKAQRRRGFIVFG